MVCDLRASRSGNIARFPSTGAARIRSPLRRHLDYTLDYMEPAFPALEGLGYRRELLREGAAYLRGLWNHPTETSPSLSFVRPDGAAG